jgi:outer membrane protein TolC
MGSITIPIAPWSSKEYKAGVRSADNSVNAINYQKQALINETVGNIAVLQTQMEAAKKQLKNFDENIIPSYYKSYRASMNAYEQNTEDLFVVLDGLKMYRLAKMNELEQLNTLLKLQVKYEKEMEIR